MLNFQQERAHKKIKCSTAITFGVIAVSIFMFFVFFVHKDQFLILENGDTGEEIYCVPAPDDFTFAVSFIHSVNKSDVIEGFQIEDGEIFVEWCKYSSFGAGMPTDLAPGEVLTYDGGQMMISHMHRAVPNLSYIVGTVYNHYLIIDDEKINICDYTPRNTKVRFLVGNKYHIRLP